MFKRLANFVNKILNNLGYYKIEDLVVGEYCGICGRSVSNKILPSDQVVAICDKCGEELDNIFLGDEHSE